MSTTRPIRSDARTAAVIVVTVVVVLLLAVIAGEARYKSCIAKAEAKFPAVAVSAFTGRGTGPLKVSFVRERAAAVDDCGRF